MSEDDLDGLIEKINSFGTKNEQDIYLQSRIELFTPKDTSKRTNDPAKAKPKSFSCKYFVEIGTEKRNVCKSAFLSLYGITVKRCRRLTELKKQNKIPQDQRGKAVGSRSNVIPGEYCVKIHDFIDALDKKEIHYSNDITRQYLSSSLNIKKLHEMFLTRTPEMADKINYQFFRQYFNSNFELSFGRPQIDVCSKCEELNVKMRDPHLNDGAKRTAAAELMIHKRRAGKFYKKVKEIQEKCASDETVLGLSFDYMQNLPLPTLPVQEIFYYRQLWVYEFCIHNMKTGKGTFYSYHEGQALKGPNEVSSFLNHYINMYVPDTITDLHLFCDGCPGQNKNNTVIRFLMALSAQKNMMIHIYFPVRGHSFNDCDRNFSVVKRKIRREDRVFTHQQYIELIVKSSNTGKFNVEKVNTGDIIDFKKWAQINFKAKPLSVRSYGKNVPRTQKVTFQVSTYYEFVFDPRKPGEVIAKSYIDSDISQEIYILSKVKNTCSNLPSQSNSAYSGKVPINHLKIADISKVKQYIPAEFIDFYEEILQWPTTTEREAAEEEF